MIGLNLYEHPARANGFICDLGRHLRPGSWRRTTRALGGYWLGDLTLTTETMSFADMVSFYNLNMGRRVVETTCGIVTWEGENVQMDLTVNGTVYRRTLDVERWHNKAKVEYTHASVEDIQQGTLAYNPVANSFQDNAQDFSDWETTSGDSTYKIYVTNADGTQGRGLLGAAFTTANANDSIYVYKDKARSTAGWKGSVSGKTPSSYVVKNIVQAGTSDATAWSETTDSSDMYGESQYIDVVGEFGSTTADAVRDRRLKEFAFPRSVPVGGLAYGAGGGGGGASLRVSCAGYVHSMNRRYRESDIGQDTMTNQITALVGASEFVSAGRIKTNAANLTVSASVISIRLWDAVEELIEIGDTSGNRWVGGVYAGRKFNYNQAATTALYHWRGGRLVDGIGQPVVASLIKPDIIVRVADLPWSVQPPGGNVWDNPHNVWIEEVEYIYPDGYRLTPYISGPLMGGI